MGDFGGSTIYKDFGFIKNANEFQFTGIYIRIIGYVECEVYINLEYTEKADIYSMGETFLKYTIFKIKNL